jgi:CheY-like chemotaxis protein
MIQPAPRHVLVVDDNAEDRAHLRSQLLLGSSQRWRFTDAATGAMALQAIQASANAPFDCVLLDYHLPDHDAPEVLAQLCEATGLTPCPVVVITGSTAHDGTGLVRTGAQDYIGKAWTTPPSLTRAVDNAIERLAMQQEGLAGRQALAVERGRLALALTAGQMGVFDLNLSDGSMVWSPEVYALFGVTEGDFVPTRASFACWYTQRTGAFLGSLCTMLRLTTMPTPHAPQRWRLRTRPAAHRCRQSRCRSPASSGSSVRTVSCAGWHNAGRRAATPLVARCTTMAWFSTSPNASTPSQPRRNAASACATSSSIPDR